MVLDSQQPLPAGTPEVLNHIEGILFHRVAWNDSIADLVQGAERAGKFLLFDTDDLVFDAHNDPSRDKGVGKFGRGQAVSRQLRTMQACRLVMTSTDYLKERAEDFGIEAHTLRNGYSAQMLRCAERTSLRKSCERVVLGYASGTPTHDRDLHLIEDILHEALERFPQLDIHLMGYIQKPSKLRRFGKRVQRRPFVAWQDLPQRLRDIDINLAPFCPDSQFSKGKSALKYMEAALVAVPTIASPMPAYCHVIEHGKNGLIANNAAQWRDHLHDLIENHERRIAVGQAAQETTCREDSLQSRAKVLESILMKAKSEPISTSTA